MTSLNTNNNTNMLLPFPGKYFPHISNLIRDKLKIIALECSINPQLDNPTLKDNYMSCAS